MEPLNAVLYLSINDIHNIYLFTWRRDLRPVSILPFVHLCLFVFLHVAYVIPLVLERLLTMGENIKCKRWKMKDFANQIAHWCPTPKFSCCSRTCILKSAGRTDE